MKADDKITIGEALAAVGYISGVLANRSGAWEGNAPDWFPEPPEWIELFEQGLERTAVHTTQD